MKRVSKSYTNVHEVIDGRLMVYQRMDVASDNYYARASFPPAKGYKVFSTKTVDVHEAQRIAKNRYYELAGRQSLNISTSVKSFVALMAEYLDYTDRLKQRDPKTHEVKYRTIFKRFIKPHFNKQDNRVNDLHRITQSDIDGYWTYRVNYWHHRSQEPEVIRSKYGNDRPRYMNAWRNAKKTPSHTTLTIEVQLLRSFFKWAVSNGHLLPGNVPDVRNPIQKIEGETYKLRGVFDIHEYRKLRDALYEKCDAPVYHRKHRVSGKQQLMTSTAYTFRAERLLAYFMLISSTGLRPQEVAKLRFSHVKLYEDQTGATFSVIDLPSSLAKANPDGTRRARRVYSFDNHLCYTRIQERWRTVLAKGMGRANDDDYIFPKWLPLNTPDREAALWTPAKMGTSFRAFLKENDLHREKGTGRPRSAYALRKFYITQRIRHNTPLAALATNTGHDIQTMWRWYAHLQSDDMRGYLTQRNPDVMKQELTEIGE